MPTDTPLADFFATACERSAHAMDIDRVGIWLFDKSKSKLRCVNMYERDKNEHSGGTILAVADFPNYFQSINLERAVPVEVALTDPRTAELVECYMKPLGVSSTLDAGIFLGGELAGVVCIEQVGPPRSFSLEDRDFATSVADLAALRLQGAQLNELSKLFRSQEQELLAVKKSELLAQMAAGVAHDFNNLLTIIEGRTTLLTSLPRLPREVREHAAPIVEACNRGQSLVRELIDFARPEKAGPPTVIDLATVLHDFLPVLRSALGSRHHLDYSCETAAAMVLINRTQFCRIVLNLVLNARDAMTDGGTVHVRLASVHTTEGNHRGQHFILLEVADTGEGMSSETLKRIGEPYFTTKESGTGLGLAIVKKNVDRAGGIIHIKSRPGHGSTFRIMLPRVGTRTGDTQEMPSLPAA